MTGPTREEVEAAVGARLKQLGFTPEERAALLQEHGHLADPMHADMAAVLTAAEPLLRARHVREAVEGLSGVDAPEDDIVRLSWVSEGGVHYSCTFPRAALLAALTGEGK